MRYHALACDYDGTIAWDGRVDERTIEALQQVRQSGRKLVLVTGRELEDLIRVFPKLELFDRVVAENGALLYRPASSEETPLAEAPPEAFVRELRRRSTQRVSAGRVIVSTWRPCETIAVEVIRDLGLELQVIFNKGAVMILPSGVNKATGLNAALLELGLSRHNVVGVGDAENDHAFLGLCECSVAVENALDTLKRRVDWVTAGGHGDGIVELARSLITSDLRQLEDRLHHRLSLGKRADGRDVLIRPYGMNVLIAGSSGGGKSTLAASFLERLEEQAYQFVIIDPEGDYSTFQAAVVLGDDRSAPSVSEVLDLLSKPEQNAVVNLIGVPLKERPPIFEALLPRIQELYARTGRPHWIVIDEAHHVLPSSWKVAGPPVSREMYSLMIVTLEPERVSQAVLSSMDLVIAIGDDPDATLRTFGEIVSQPPARLGRIAVSPGEAVAWFRHTPENPFWFRSSLPRAERRPLRTRPGARSRTDREG